LANLPVFQKKYAETIVARILYMRTNYGNSNMTFLQFKNSGFYDRLVNLNNVQDINLTRDIFSYQHFYVIYCKFWELDENHDMQINLENLKSYDFGSMTPAILDRAISGAGKPSSLGPKNKLMSYEDFVWFILSVEDKSTIQATNYWFKCVDIDGDGKISLYELEYFYQQQLERMNVHMKSEIWRFEDFICSMSVQLT
jgi:serine/threonine-protein phosphatase 2A regulatory subunit B''